MFDCLYYKNIKDQKNEGSIVHQGSCDRPPSSPQPSVDRLSVTWADPGSMTSSGVNLFHIPSETPISNEVKFSPTAGEVSEDEDYSASLSAVLRQRRASVRRSRKGRSRRPSSPFLPDETRSRRRSSIFTTSSGDTAISIDEVPLVTQEQIFENIHLHKEVLGSVKQQPLGMRRKLKIVHQAKGYIKRHEGQLQERLAQSKSTRDIYARFNILIATKWQQLKREAANTSNLLIPWELRIKEIESHFGSVVASYFTFLRWLFWVNLVIGFILLVFVITPEYLTANPLQDGERKIIMEEERRNSTNLLTMWEFDGVLKYSPIFYGYYSNVERPEYRMPLAYFLTGLVVYIYSFVAILRKMAENSRMSKLSEKEDECIFSWKLFTGWDFMIGNAETAHNRIASVILGFKEALLEEAEKKKDPRNWRIISLRALVIICVIILLGLSAYVVVTVVTRSDDNSKPRSWLRENETTLVVTAISLTFPVFFDLLGLLEHNHPRKQLRLQLARIMLLNLLNLYSLIFALFSKIQGMSAELDSLQPSFNLNTSVMADSAIDINRASINGISGTCHEIIIPCLPCHLLSSSEFVPKESTIVEFTSTELTKPTTNIKNLNSQNLLKETKTIGPENLKIYEDNENNVMNDKGTIDNSILLLMEELDRLRNISSLTNDSIQFYGSTTDNFENYETTPLDTSTDSSSSSNSDGLITSEYKDDYLDRHLNNDLVSSNIDYKEKEETTTFTDSNFVNVIMSETTESTYFDWSTEKQGSDSDLHRGAELTTEDFIESTEINAFPSVIPTVTTKVYDDTNLSFTGETETTGKTNYPIYVDENNESSDNYTNNIDTTTTTEESEWKENQNRTISDFTTTSTTMISYLNSCKNISFNCSFNCNGKNITKVFFMSNCTISDIKCYVNQCEYKQTLKHGTKNQFNLTVIDKVYYENNRKMYNLTKETKKKLLKLCWETMFGQELVKLTVMDLVVGLLGTLFLDFFRALFVRYMNQFWCWDLEKKFPEYGDFKIAENILHLINNQGMIQLRRERTEERRKMFQLADTRRRTGSSAVENTPFTRWKKTLPALPLSKSIDSDDRKTSDETKEDSKNLKRGIFAKIVGLALDKKPEVEITSPSSYAVDGDNDVYETLPKEILKTKDMTVPKISDHKKKSNVEFKSTDSDIMKYKSEQGCLKVKIDKLCERTDKKAVLEKLKEDKIIEEELTSLPSKTIIKESNTKNDGRKKSFDTKQTSESSTYSRQSDSISSVIPVITISTTESDEEQLQYPKVVGEQKKDRSYTNSNPKQELSKTNRSSSDLKSLRRQSSIDSINDSKTPKEKKTEDGYKYQYSL
ncbi:Transmembrane channel-like protein 3 [Papilio machaon]|uniref:Transmembrane channel-like protein 3 n=1 Tax=Papilio machaon TaxID=76193 RepID=A0A194QUU3_PAPMA|nr:Transmembrane channel-like protein 3 [Papilio machaon]